MSDSMSIASWWKSWNSLLVVRASSEEDGRIPCSWCSKGIVTFYSDDHSQTAKDASFIYTSVGVPVNMSFLKLQKRYMLAHEAIAMGTIVAIIKINIAGVYTCGAQNLMVADEYRKSLYGNRYHALCSQFSSSL